MYKLCKTEQSAARQRELELGLLQMMALKRYEDITISDLCQRMQIPRKSFYRYFSSKDGALFALLDHTMLEFFEMSFRQQQNRSALKELENFFQFWYHHKELLDALERSQLSGILVERATALAQREHLFPQRMKSWPAELQGVAISFAICGLMSMVISWHHQGYPVGPSDMTRTATILLTQPLLQRDPL